MITKHEIQPGQTIEDEVSLANRLKISRPTVRHAFQDLAAKGLLSHRRGVGTRVSPTPVQRQVKFSSLNDDLIRAGYTIRAEVLHYEVHFANDDISKKLGCEVGSEIIFFERLRWLDSSRFALMHNYVPSGITPSLTDLARDGFYRCLAQSGVQLQSGYQQVGARNATEYEVKMLHVNPAAALVTTGRIAYGETGHTIEYASHCYDAAQYAITMPLMTA